MSGIRWWNQFAVIADANSIQAVMFEGSEKDVYEWLKQNAVLDAPGFQVVNRLLSVSWEEGEFIREYEEKQTKNK